MWIAEDIELIARGVESRSWIDSALAGVNTGLDGLALASSRTLENVHRIANRLGIDLRSVDVKLVDDPEEIQYLDHMRA